MKMILTILLFVSLVSFTNGQWVKTNYTQSWPALAVNGTRLFADKSFSTDNGSSWNLMKNGFPHDAEIKDFEISGSKIFATVFSAGTDSSGVYLSINNGTNWTLVNKMKGSYSILKIISKGAYIIASGEYIYTSADNGINWSQTVKRSFYPYSLAASDKYAFLSTHDGIYMSNFNDLSYWYDANYDFNQGLSNGNTTVSALLVSGTNLFAGTSNKGIFLSTDNGSTFQPVNNGLKDTYVNVLYESGNTLFAGTNFGIYVSTDGGLNWYNAGLKEYVMDIVNLGGYLVASTYSGIWKRNISEMTSLVTLLSPNGGENLTIGTVHNITWKCIGISNVKIEYSTDNGTSWSTIIASTPASTGNYGWTIPNTPSTKCLVRISDVSNSYVNNSSNNEFKITAIKVDSPNGGEDWFSGTNQNIKWNTSVITNVKIEYSTDNGTSWSTIIASTPASTGNYNWFIPSKISKYCLIRISDASNSNLYDMSDDVFTVEIKIKYLTHPKAKNWVKIGLGSVEPRIYSLLKSNSKLFVGTSNGIRISTDAGTNWLSNSVSSVANAFASNGTDVYAAIPNEIIHYLNDYNAWEILAKTTKSMSAITYNGVEYYAGTADGDIYVLNQGERVWKLAGSIATGVVLNSLQADGSTLYASTNKGIYSSNNKGSSWVIAQNAKNQIPYEIFAVGFSGTYFFIGTNSNAVWYSSVIGKYVRITPIDYTVYSIVIISQDEIYCSTNSGVRQFLRDGDGWIQYDVGLMNIQTPALIKDGNILFAGTIANGLYKLDLLGSTDIGNQGISETNFEVSQNYPNPFNPSTVIKFNIPQESRVSISVYNVLGQRITELVNENKSPGHYEVNWNATNISSGVYVYKIEAIPTNGDKAFTQFKKMIFMK